MGLLAGCQCERRQEAPWVVPAEEEWKALQFGGDGAVQWSDGELSLDLGAELTGALYEGDLPEIPYELELEAEKRNGSDFFCGLTFPVRSKDECLTLIVGGWGGGTVGLSSVDGEDASRNETTSYHLFEKNRWYAVRLRVTEAEVEVWIDGEQVIDLAIEGKSLGLRPGMIELCAPFGVGAWQTEAGLRGIRWRSLAD